MGPTGRSRGVRREERKRAELSDGCVCFRLLRAVTGLRRRRGAFGVGDSRPGPGEQEWGAEAMAWKVVPPRLAWADAGMAGRSRHVDRAAAVGNPWPCYQRRTDADPDQGD